MTQILRGRRFGFSLEEIRQWLELYEKADIRHQMEALIKMADRQLIGLQRQQNGLGLAFFDLRALRMQTPEQLKH